MSLNPLEQINYITITAVIVIYLVTYFVLRKIFFVPVIEMMEKRTARIEAARTKKAEADSLLSEAQLKAEAILAEASEQAELMAEAAKEEIIKDREAKITKANAKADEIQAEGREKVLAIKQSEQAKLKEDLCVCVTQTLTKIVSRVDEKTVRYVVNKVLAAKGATR